jgi:uncharacterized repeat protein (TIGR03803 family)
MVRILHFIGACIAGCLSAVTMFVPLSAAAAKSSETVLYAFEGGNDGAAPYAGLIGDKAGNLYGTTSAGGGAGCGNLYQSGCGTVFKVKE